MKSRRLSIAGLMLAVALCGLGLAALRARTEPWDVLMETLAVVLVLGAAIGAFARRGRWRFVWAGFAVFGVLGIGPQAMSHLGALLPEYGLSFVGDPPPIAELPEFPPLREARLGRQIRHSLGAILFAAIGAIVGGLVYRDPGEDRQAPDAQDHLPPDLS